MNSLPECLENFLLKDFLSTTLTVCVDIVGQEEIQLPDGDVDVVRVDTERGMEAVGGLFQPLPVSALQGDSLEQDHLHQVQPPYLEIQFNSILYFISHRSIQYVLFSSYL